MCLNLQDLKYYEVLKYIGICNDIFEKIKIGRKKRRKQTF